MGLLYSKMKIFHFKEKLDSLPAKVPIILAPLHIRLKPTNRCNHNCSYCAYRSDAVQLGKDMRLHDEIPRDTMMALIDDFIRMGVKAVTFSGGGEPLVYPYILEALEKLAKSPIKFATLTNASKLSGEIARIFSQKGTWVRVSLDGWNSESYAKYRRVSKEEFGKVMQNLKNFKKLEGKCLLGVVVIVDKNNARHIYEIIKNLKKIGVDSVKVSPCVISDKAKVNNAYHKPYFKIVAELVEKAKAEFESKNFEISNAYCEQLETFSKNYTWCSYLQIRPVIGADLNLYSCQDKAYNLKCGFICSLKNTSFKEAWFKNKNKFFKINPKIHCQHHCVAHEHNKMILDYLNADKEHGVFV